LCSEAGVHGGDLRTRLASLGLQRTVLLLVHHLPDLGRLLRTPFSLPPKGEISHTPEKERFCTWGAGLLELRMEVRIEK
jgi:hypothetical protein